LKHFVHPAVKPCRFWLTRFPKAIESDGFIERDNRISIFCIGKRSGKIFSVARKRHSSLGQGKFI